MLDPLNMFRRTQSTKTAETGTVPAVGTSEDEAPEHHLSVTACVANYSALQRS